MAFRAPATSRRVYWTEQDLVIGDEYRDGNVPAGMDNLGMFNLAGKISTHAGSLVLCICKVAEQIVGLIAARTKLLQLLPQPA